MDANSLGTIIGGLVAVFGAGGLVATIKAVLDYHAGKHTREQAVEDSYVDRLEKTIEQQAKRIAHLETQREQQTYYAGSLVFLLAQNGVTVPPLDPSVFGGQPPDKKK